MSGCGNNTQHKHGDGDCRNSTNQRNSNVLSAPAPQLQVTHALQQYEINKGCGRSYVVRHRPGFDGKAHQQYSGHNYGKTHFAVPEDPRESQQGNRKQRSAVVFPRSCQLVPGAADGAPDGSVSQETLQLPAIEIAHDYMVVERLGFGRFPQKIWCCCIGATIHLVCHSEGAARNSPIVVSRASCGSTEDDQSGQDNATQRKRKCGMPATKHPDGDSSQYRDAEYQTFVRSAVCQDGKSDRHVNRVHRARVSPDARPRS